MSDIFTEVAAIYARQDARRRERVVREMLGRWVSELEPMLVIDHHGELAGLTWNADWMGRRAPIVVWAEGYREERAFEDVRYGRSLFEMAR